MTHATPATHRSRRTARGPRRAVTATVVASLALTALGAGAAHADTARKDTTRTTATVPVDPRLLIRDPSTVPSSVPTLPNPYLEFLYLIHWVGQPCSWPQPDRPTATKTPTTKAPTTKAPRTAPTTAPKAPEGIGLPDTRPAPGKPSLNVVERCEAPLHAARIARALKPVKRLTPARVRQVLNQDGYYDKVLHGVKRWGKGTQFVIDLRLPGGSLGLVGQVAPGKTVFTPVAVAPTGPFAPPVWAR
ncbi:hypothetical protein JNUCC64_19120 [Streptomyces sp. JNUCC 64]